MEHVSRAAVMCDGVQNEVVFVDIGVVKPVPIITLPDVPAEGLVFDAFRGIAMDRMVTIRNDGLSAVNFTLDLTSLTAFADGPEAPWFTAAPVQGTIAPGDSQAIKLTLWTRNTSRPVVERMTQELRVLIDMINIPGRALYPEGSLQTTVLRPLANVTASVRPAVAVDGPLPINANIFRPLNASLTGARLVNHMPENITVDIEGLPAWLRIVMPPLNKLVPGPNDIVMEVDSMRLPDVWGVGPSNVNIYKREGRVLLSTVAAGQLVQAQALVPEVTPRTANLRFIYTNVNATNKTLAVGGNYPSMWLAPPGTKLAFRARPTPAGIQLERTSGLLPMDLLVMIDHKYFQSVGQQTRTLTFDVNVENQPVAYSYVSTVNITFELREPDQIPTDWWKPWEGASRLTAADADETSVVSCDKADALQADNVHCEFRPRSCGTPFAAEAAGFVVEITDGKMTRQVFFTGDVQEVFGFSFGADAFSGAVGVRVRHSTDGRPVARTEVFVSGTPDETSVLVCPSDSVRVGESMSCTLSTRSCGRPVPSSVDALVADSLGGSAIVSANAVPSRDSFDITFVAGMKSVLGSVEIFVNDVPVATANIAVLDTPDATSNITCERTTVLTYGSVTCSVELRRAGEPAFVAAGSCSVEWLAGSVSMSTPAVWSHGDVVLFAGGMEHVSRAAVMCDGVQNEVVFVDIGVVKPVPIVTLPDVPAEGLVFDAFRGIAMDRMVTIRNDGLSAVNFTLDLTSLTAFADGPEAPWFTAAPVQGTIAPGDSQAIKLTLWAMNTSRPVVERMTQELRVLIDMINIPGRALYPEGSLQTTVLRPLANVTASVRPAVAVDGPLPINANIFRPLNASLTGARLVNHMPENITVDIEGLPAWLRIVMPPLNKLVPGPNDIVMEVYSMRLPDVWGVGPSNVNIYKREGRMLLSTVAAGQLVQAQALVPEVTPRTANLRFIYTNVNATNKTLAVGGNYPSMWLAPTGTKLAFRARPTPAGIQLERTSGLLPMDLLVMIDHKYFQSVGQQTRTLAFDVNVENQPVAYSYVSTVNITFELREPDQIPTDWWKPWEGASRLTAADADETSVVSCDKADALQADNVHCEFRPRSCGTPFAAEAAGFVVEITDGKMTRQVFFTGDVQEVFGFSFGADAFSGAVGVRVRHSTDGRPVARTEVFVSGTPDETSVLVCPSDSVRVGESMSCTLSTRSCGRPVPSSVDALVAFSLGGSAIVSANAVPSRDSFDITFVAGMKSVLGSVEIFVNDVPVATANIAVLDTPDATSNITCERTTVLTYGSVTCSVELRRAGEPAFVAAGSCSVEWLAGSVSMSTPAVWSHGDVVLFAGGMEHVSRAAVMCDGVQNEVVFVDIGVVKPVPIVTLPDVPTEGLVFDAFRGIAMDRMVTIRNDGLSAVNFTLDLTSLTAFADGPEAPWFTAAPVQGTIAPGDSQAIKLTLWAMNTSRPVVERMTQELRVLIDMINIPGRALYPEGSLQTTVLRPLANVTASVRPAVAVDGPLPINANIFRPLNASLTGARLVNHMPENITVDIEGLPAWLRIVMPPLNKLVPGPNDIVMEVYSMRLPDVWGVGPSNVNIYKREGRMLLSTVAAGQLVQAQALVPEVTPRTANLRFIYTNVNATNKTLAVGGNYPSMWLAPPGTKLAFRARPTPAGIQLERTSGLLPMDLLVMIDHKYFQSVGQQTRTLAFDVNVENQPVAFSYVSTVNITFELREPDQIPTDWWKPWESASRLTAADADETSVVSCDKADALQADNVHCEFRPRSCGTPFAAEAAGFVVEITDGKMTRQVFFTGDVQEVFGFSFGADAFSGAVGVRVRHSTDGRPVARTEVFVSGTPDETSVLGCPSLLLPVYDSVDCVFEARSCGRPVELSVSALTVLSSSGMTVLERTASGAVRVRFTASGHSGPARIEVLVADASVAATDIGVTDVPDHATLNCGGRDAMQTNTQLSCSLDLLKSGLPVHVSSTACSVEWSLGAISMTSGALWSRSDVELRAGPLAGISAPQLFCEGASNPIPLSPINVRAPVAPALESESLGFNARLFIGVPLTWSFNLRNMDDFFASDFAIESRVPLLDGINVTTMLAPSHGSLSPSGVVKVNVTMLATGRNFSAHSLHFGIVAQSAFSGNSSITASFTVLSVMSTVEAAVRLEQDARISVSVFRPFNATFEDVIALVNAMPDAPLPALDLVGVPHFLHVEQRPRAMAAPGSVNLSMIFETSKIRDAASGFSASPVEVYRRGGHGLENLLFVIQEPIFDVSAIDPAVLPAVADLRFIYTNVNATNKTLSLSGSYPAAGMRPLFPSGTQLEFRARPAPAGVQLLPSSGVLPMDILVMIDHNVFKNKERYTRMLTFDVGVTGEPLSFVSTVNITFELRDEDEVPPDWWKPWEGASRRTAVDADETSVVSCDKADALQADNVHCEFRPRSCATPFAAEAAGFVVEITDGKMTRQVFFTGDVQEVFDFSFGADAFSGAVGVRVRHSTDGRPVARTEVFVSAVPDATSALVCNSPSIAVSTAVTCTLAVRSCGSPVPVSLSALGVIPSAGVASVFETSSPDTFEVMFVAGAESGSANIAVLFSSTLIASADVFVTDMPDATSSLDIDAPAMFVGKTIPFTITLRRQSRPAYVTEDCFVIPVGGSASIETPPIWNRVAGSFTAGADEMEGRLSVVCGSADINSTVVSIWREDPPALAVQPDRIDFVVFQRFVGNATIQVTNAMADTAGVELHVDRPADLFLGVVDGKDAVIPGDGSAVVTIQLNTNNGPSGPLEQNFTSESLITGKTRANRRPPQYFGVNLTRVAVSVRQPGFLAATPSRIDVAALRPTDDSEIVSVFNPDVLAYPFQFEQLPSWLSVSHPSGVIQSGETLNITFTFSSEMASQARKRRLLGEPVKSVSFAVKARLPADVGMHEVVLDIPVDGAAYTPQLELPPSGTISLGRFLRPRDPSVSVELKNPAPVPLDVSFTYFGEIPWVVPEATAGSIAANSTAAFGFNVSLSNIADDGIALADMIFNVSSPSSAVTFPSFLAVSVEVWTPKLVIELVEPLAFADPQNNALVTIKALKSRSYNFTISVKSPPTHNFKEQLYAVVEPLPAGMYRYGGDLSGNVTDSVSATIPFTVNAGELSVGVNVLEVAIDVGETLPGLYPQRFNVTVDVYVPEVQILNTAGLSQTQFDMYGLIPTSQTLTFVIGNNAVNGFSDVNWAINKAEFPAWLELQSSEEQGNLALGSSTGVTLKLSTAALGAASGSFSLNVIVEGGAKIQSLVIVLNAQYPQLTVDAGQAVQSTQTNAVATLRPDPWTATLTLANTDYGLYPEAVAFSMPQGYVPSYVSISPSSGSVGDSQSFVTVTLDTTSRDLPEGDTTTEVTLAIGPASLPGVYNRNVTFTIQHVVHTPRLEVTSAPAPFGLYFMSTASLTVTLFNPLPVPVAFSFGNVSEAGSELDGVVAIESSAASNFVAASTSVNLTITVQSAALPAPLGLHVVGATANVRAPGSASLSPAPYTATPARDQVTVALNFSVAEIMVQGSASSLVFEVLRPQVLTQNFTLTNVADLGPEYPLPDVTFDVDASTVSAYVQIAADPAGPLRSGAASQISVTFDSTKMATDVEQKNVTVWFFSSADQSIGGSFNVLLDLTAKTPTLTAPNVDFGNLLRQQTQSKELVLTEPGYGNVKWQVKPGTLNPAAGVSLSQESGNVAKGGTSTITVTFNTQPVSDGPASVSVSIEVGGEFLDYVPEPITFTVSAGVYPPNLDVKNPDPQFVLSSRKNYTFIAELSAPINPDYSWATQYYAVQGPSPSALMVVGGDRGEVSPTTPKATVHMNMSGIEMKASSGIGDRTATAAVWVGNNAQPDNTYSETISVAVTVVDPEISLYESAGSENQTNLAKAVSGFIPLPQTFSVTLKNDRLPKFSDINFAVKTSDASWPAWLNVSVTSGTLGPDGGSQDLSFTVLTDVLGETSATYDVLIELEEHENGEGTAVAVQQKITITAEAVLAKVDVDDSNANRGTEVILRPESWAANVTLTNAVARFGAIDYRVPTSAPSYVSISPAGSTIAGAPVVLDVLLNTSDPQLPEGHHVTEVTLEIGPAGSGRFEQNTTFRITHDVRAPALTAAAAPSFGLYLRSNASRTVTLSNPLPVPVEFEFGATSQSGVELKPAKQQVQAGGTFDVTLDIADSAVFGVGLHVVGATANVRAAGSASLSPAPYTATPARDQVTVALNFSVAEIMVQGSASSLVFEVLRPQVLTQNFTLTNVADLGPSTRFRT
eukprot:tig00000691_g3174.t1